MEGGDGLGGKRTGYNCVALALLTSGSVARAACC